VFVNTDKFYVSLSPLKKNNNHNNSSIDYKTKTIIMKAKTTLVLTTTMPTIIITKVQQRMLKAHIYKGLVDPSLRQ